MPNDMNVWIIVAIVAGLVIGLAVWLGRGLIIKKDGEGYSVQVEKSQAPDTRSDDIQVAANLEMKDVEAGDVAGRKVASAEGVGDRVQNIEVLKGGKIVRTKLGDIVGIKQEGPATTDEKKS